MAKCSDCGRYMSTLSCVRCCRCTAMYHKKCANVPEGETVGAAWMCTICKTATPETQLDLSSASSSSPAMASPMGSLHDPTIKPAGADFAVLVAQIGSMRSEISALRDEVREYRNEIADFKDQLSSQKESVIKIETRVSVLEEKFENMIPYNTDPIENAMSELKCQLNERDQELLLNDIDIAGIPESREECLGHIIRVLTTKLGVEIEERDIIHVERVGSTRRNKTESTASVAADPSMQQPRRISVRFARRATRDQVLRAARVRRNLKSNDLELSGAPSRVYVNERLTRENRQLFYHAKQAGNRGNWRFVWTKDGKILARRGEGQKTERIRCFKDIDRVFC